MMLLPNVTDVHVLLPMWLLPLSPLAVEGVLVQVVAAK